MENVHLIDLVHLAIGIAVFVAVSMLLDDRARRARAIYLFIMSRLPARPRAAPGMPPVSIPVPSMEYQSGGMEGTDAPAPDMDAAKGSIPPGWRDISTEDLIVALAVLRGPDGKYRSSANKIAEYVGGDRNTVMARVREVRAGPPTPVFPPRTAEQVSARAELGL